ncbi:MAG: 4-alpha-glucanotransferase [Ferruginibacter sp.]
MLIHFFIKFSSSYGDSVRIDFTGVPGESGISFPLEYLDDEYWHVKIQSAALPDENILSYSVTIFQQEVSKEIITNRKINLKKVKQDFLEIVDGPEETELYSNVFAKPAFIDILKKQKQKTKKHDKEPDYIFKVQVPPTGEGKLICIIGSSKKLKSWDDSKPICLTQKENIWSIRLQLSKEQFPVEYKFGIYDIEKKKIVEYEKGENRVLISPPGKDTLRIFHCFPDLSGYKWKGAGVNIPLSSVRTVQTWGAGNFSSLNMLVDWAKKTGLKLIQLLPINDTSATLTKKDSYPYSPISVFALHPMFMNVQKLATAFGVELSIEKMRKIHELNSLDQIDYEAVMILTMNTLKELYAIEKQSFKDDYAWFEYFDINRHWLVPYAAFCFLKDKYGTAEFSEWNDHKVYDEAAVQELVSIENENYDEIAFYYFIQYHLHLQCKDAKEYAHKNDILLKGDLPIGVGRCSVDTWMYPDLFHMDMQAGAPPDAFTSKGQNWKFPTYNWKEMEKNNYTWWRQRLEHMGNYFDAVRIDHILGFYRIWSIPYGSEDSILGRFEPVLAVTKQNFQEAGLYLDEERFCKPYINYDKLHGMFGDNSGWVKDTFIQDGKIKSALNTSQKISNYFEVNTENKHLQTSVNELLSDVILLKDNRNAEEYHFRINMHQTASYRSLSGEDQKKLDYLSHNYFFENQNKLWEEAGRKKLMAVKSFTDMLVCAEDLGMVPHFVEGMLADMKILSLEIQRMPKKSTDTFAHPNNAPYLSVVTPSTHDMSTLQEWWKEEKQIQYFYNDQLAHPGDAPVNCEPSICKEIVMQHMQSPAMWSIFLMQDLLSIHENTINTDLSKERINIPADPEHTWNYRMHLTMEDLLGEKDHISEIKNMVRQNGR